MLPLAVVRALMRAFMHFAAGSGGCTCGRHIWIEVVKAGWLPQTNRLLENWYFHMTYWSNSLKSCSRTDELMLYALRAGCCQRRAAP